MPPAPLPDNEKERLNALKRYGVLDSELEAVFDQITGVAAEFFDAPVSMINFIDEKRQWTKSHHGVDLTEMPRDEAFCSFTILGDDVMVVPDAQKDARFIDNPLVTGDPNIRFYAGAPLVTHDGFHLGALCVVDAKARTKATPHQVEVLQRLAKLVTYELDLRLAHRQRLEQLSIISHELRSPLNAILGFSDVMREEVFGPLGNPRYRAYAEDIHRSGLHLLSLVNDLLDVGKLQSGKFELHEETIDLHEIVLEVTDRIRGEAAKRDIRVEVEIAARDSILTADRRAMVQILTNLVSNAVKFSNPGGVVLVQLKIEDDVLVKVSDHGVGIPPDDIVKIFDSFTQGSHSRGGTGLGLSIVKHLAELHGGDVTVESVVGAGATFTVRLPGERLLRN